MTGPAVGGPLTGATVVVIGGGVVGSALAYRMAQGGAAVTLVDAAAADTASDVSFAWLNAFDKYPRDYWLLNSSGIAEYRQLQDECSGGWLAGGGSLRWAPPGSEVEAKQVTAVVRTMRQWGGVVEELTAAAATDLEPGLVLPAGVELVYRFPTDGWVDTVAMRRDLRATAEKRFGARFLTDEVTGFVVRDGVILRVVLASSAELDADLVILAAGAATSGLARLAGAELPVGGHTSALLRTSPLPTRLGHVIGGETLWIRPDPDGGLVIGSSLLPQRAAEVRAEPQLVATVLAQVEQLLPAAGQARLAAIVEGTQPVPPDNFPVVGFDPDVSNLYHVVSRSGVSLAARLARLVVADLQEAQPELLRFRPSRLAVGGRTMGPPGEQ